MLTRPLFEDMVVMHWLILHEEDPDLLVKRFHDQLDAIRLLEADIYKRFKWSPEPDVADIRTRQRELQQEFGPWVTRDWWGIRADGRRIDLPQIVNELSKVQRFHPRFAGEQPVLRMHYELATKFAAQCLHRTGVGFPVRLDKEDPRAVHAVPSPSPFRVLSTAYWTFGQLVYLTLDVQERDFREFEAIFLDGIYNVFGNAPEMRGDDSTPGG